MKFWKKMALGSTAVLAAMSLAACSNGSSNSSSSSSSSNKSANLTLWVDTEQVPYYKQIAKDFTKKNKKVLTVQLTLRLMLVRTHQRLPMYLKFLTTN